MTPETSEAPPTKWRHAVTTANKWRHAVTTATEAGFTHFDWLDCSDQIGRTEEFCLTLCLRHGDPYRGEETLIETSIPRDEASVDSLSDVFPGITWSEREIADLFGISFTGGDPRPLLLPPDFGAHPLRKESVAAARVAASWPGAKEPGDAAPSRRRMVPPGVPDPEVWGARDADAPEPDPADVAGSSEGGRVRRRRTR